ncbi:MAG TPA: hypothetical protein VH681_09140 [Nitrospiraceae bacterium]|jgi:hypothetical protein
MDSEWLDSTTGSLLVLFIMGCTIAGVSTFIAIVLMGILGKDQDVETLDMRERTKEPPFRMAA